MPDPLYRQIAEDLQRKIDAGELGRDGEALPTEIELRDLYDASRNTVRDAIKLLTTRGVVEPRAGKGTFVIEKVEPYTIPLSVESGVGAEGSAEFTSDVAARLRSPVVSVPVIEVTQAANFVAGELGVPVGETVVSRHQRRFIDNTPWSLQTTYYPMRYVERGATDLLIAKDISDGAVTYLREALNIEQVGWRDRITVRAPDPVESAFFRLPDDGRISIFEVQRTGFEADGTPIRLTITTYPADRNQFVVVGGAVPDETVTVPEGSIEPEPVSQPIAGRPSPTVRIPRTT